MARPPRPPPAWRSPRAGRAALPQAGNACALPGSPARRLRGCTRGSRSRARRPRARPRIFPPARAPLRARSCPASPTPRSRPGSRGSPPPSLPPREPLGQPPGYGRGYECLDVTAETRDLADQARRQERVCRVGRHEQHLDVGRQMLVHERHLELEFEVRHRAQTAQDGPRADPPREVHGESRECLDTDAGLARRDLAQHLYTILDREERLLGRVRGHADPERIDDRQRAADEVLMSPCYGIERAGIEAHESGAPPCQGVASVRRKIDTPVSPYRRVSTSVPCGAAGCREDACSTTAAVVHQPCPTTLSSNGSSGST